jgi:cell division protein FtsB
VPARPTRPAPRTSGRRSVASGPPRGRARAGGLALPDDIDLGGPDQAPRSSSTTRLAVLALVLALLAISYAYPVQAFFHQRALLADAQAQRAALQAELADLQQQQRRWDDPAYVRAQARERLGFTMPGEVGLVVVGSEEVTGPPPPTGPVVPAIGADRAWWQRLWAGVELAGSPPPDEIADQLAATPDEQ